MKKLFLILLVAMLVNSVTASSRFTDTIYLFSADQYQLKINWQPEGEIEAEKLPAGIDMTKAGMHSVPVAAKWVNNKPSNNLNTEDGLFTTGIAAIFTGEPVFVVSSKHKKRALSVSTTEQVIRKMQRNSISRVSVPSIKLTIHL